MWKLSATKAIEFVTYPTTNSMMKKLVVRAIMESKRHFFPEYRPIFLKWKKKLISTIKQLVVYIVSKQKQITFMLSNYITISISENSSMFVVDYN